MYRIPTVDRILVEDSIEMEGKLGAAIALGLHRFNFDRLETKS